MKQGTLAFFISAILFSTGTSIIGYALAQNSSLISPVKILNKNTAPWYCVAESNGTTPGYITPGYRTPGYNTPGYNTPGYTTPPITPGYTVPGYVAPGYTVPGYVAPGYKQPGYILPNYASAFAYISSPTYYKQGWTSLLKCPTGYKLQPTLVELRCNKVLQNKLNGLKLPADSAAQYNDCKGIINPTVWDAKISTKNCAAYVAYEKDCATAQKKKQRCSPLSGYLSKAGVSTADMKKAQLDVITYCKNVFPQ